MQHITSIERMAIQKGREEGREDVEQHHTYLRQAATVSSLIAFKALLVNDMSA